MAANLAVQTTLATAKHRATVPGMSSSEKSDKDEQIGFRCSSAQRAAWEAAARKDSRTLTSWIIARLNGLPTTAPVLIEQAEEPAPAKPRRRAR